MSATRIAGIESTLEVVPFDGFHLSLSGTCNDARLRNVAYNNPAYVVLPGERLPEAPIFNFSAIVRYERRIAANTAFALLDIEHKGGMYNSLQCDQWVLHPEYSLVNLRVGLSDANGTWRAKGYVTNAANKRAVIYQDTTGYLSYPGITSETLATPPRTVGLRLSYRWKLRS